MSDRTELLEAALDNLPEGIAVCGDADEVVGWNPAAEAITGFAGIDLLRRPIPEMLAPLLAPLFIPLSQDRPLPVERVNQTLRGTLLRVRHKQGHEVAVRSRALVLRDGLGRRIGTAAMFHAAENLDALPHGETQEDADAVAGQADLEDRLQTGFEDFLQGGRPFGVLWIAVDQAHALRRTHGAAACHAMLDKVRRALAPGLRPSEAIGRWGDEEFLAIAHEPAPEMLAAHAQRLAGLARTADFRWWGDRISLTVSIGAAQVETGQEETLAQLLKRARNAMEGSMREGGNRTTFAPGVKTCLPS